MSTSLPPRNHGSNQNEVDLPSPIKWRIWGRTSHIAFKIPFQPHVQLDGVSRSQKDLSRTYFLWTYSTQMDLYLLEIRQTCLFRAKGANSVIDLIPKPPESGGLQMCFQAIGLRFFSLHSKLPQKKFLTILSSTSKHDCGIKKLEAQNRWRALIVNFYQIQSTREWQQMRFPACKLYSNLINKRLALHACEPIREKWQAEVLDRKNLLLKPRNFEFSLRIAVWKEYSALSKICTQTSKTIEVIW